MINPTNCSPFSVASEGIGDEGTPASFSSYFQAVNCILLPFTSEDDDHPTRWPRGDGAKQGPEPRVRPEQLSPGDANIKSVTVTLPKAFEIDQRHLGNLCSKAQLETERCAGRQPIGSVIDETPLLEKPLKGLAYAVSGYGGSGNVLPHVAFILDGQVTIIPQAESTSIAGGHLRTVVPVVPDAPIGHFRFTLFGGSQGYLVNTRSLCEAPAVIGVEFTRPKRQDPEPAGEDEDRLQGTQEDQASSTSTQLSFQDGATRYRRPFNGLPWWGCLDAELWDAGMRSADAHPFRDCRARRVYCHRPQSPRMTFRRSRRARAEQAYLPAEVGRRRRVTLALVSTLTATAIALLSAAPAFAETLKVSVTGRRHRHRRGHRMRQRRQILRSPVCRRNPSSPSPPTPPNAQPSPAGRAAQKCQARPSAGSGFTAGAPDRTSAPNSPRSPRRN